MPRKELPPPENDIDRRVLDSIRRVGGSVVAALPGKDQVREPSLALSLGLIYTFAHPEVIVLGLHFHLAQRLIRAIADAVAQGQRMQGGQLCHGLPRGPIAFLAVDPAYYDEYLGDAVWLYGGQDFPALQCVWRLDSGHYPWDPGYDPKEAANQPLLGDVPPMTAPDRPAE